MGLKDCRVGVLMAVSDLDTARRFYEDQLGLVPGEQEQDGVRYFCAEGTSVFVYLQPHNAGGREPGAQHHPPPPAPDRLPHLAAARQASDPSRRRRHGAPPQAPDVASD